MKQTKKYDRKFGEKFVISPITSSSFVFSKKMLSYCPLQQQVQQQDKQLEQEQDQQQQLQKQQLQQQQQLQQISNQI